MPTENNQREVVNLNEVPEKEITKRVCYDEKYRECFQGLVKHNELFKAAQGIKEKVKIYHKIKNFSMRSLVQVVEMTSWVNCGFASQNMGRNPTCEEAASYYLKNGGAERFAIKWPGIWHEIICSENTWYSGVACYHSPDFVERYIHWLVNEGLEKFYGKHPEYLVCEVLTAKTNSVK